MPNRQIIPWKTRAANFGMVFFGMIMAVTPLALWVAPTKFWFYFVLEMFAISSVMVWFLSSYESTAAEYQKLQASKRSVWDKTAALLQRLNPFNRPSDSDIELQKLANKHRKEIRKRSDD